MTSLKIKTKITLPSGETVKTKREWAKALELWLHGMPRSGVKRTLSAKIRPKSLMDVFVGMLGAKDRQQAVKQRERIRAQWEREQEQQKKSA